LFDGGLYLFGGTDGEGNMLNDLWKYEGSEWKEIEIKGEKPLPLRGHAAAVLGSTLFVFGGETLSSPNHLNESMYASHSISTASRSNY
jgi:N-acetylneuraminic acid mutarotase